jgi:anti-sigma regulatory factor (Ser/Thr protein kinase)
VPAAAACPSDDLVSLRLEGGPEAAALARRALARLGSELSQDSLDTVRLLVTELVTNSVRHGTASAVDLRVHVCGPRVRLDVHDEGSGFTPQRRQPGQDPEGGWGLYLVERLADRWGVDTRGGGTHVWLELERV